MASSVEMRDAGWWLVAGGDQYEIATVAVVRGQKHQIREPYAVRHDHYQEPVEEIQGACADVKRTAFTQSSAEPDS